MVRAQRTWETQRRVKKERQQKQLHDEKAFKRYDTNPQLSLLLKNAPHYEKSLPLPYELLMKIFHYSVEISDHPIRDLCNLAQVCETWRIMIIHSPSLWTRINFRQMPLTDGNFRLLAQLVNLSPAILGYVQEVYLKGVITLKDSRSTAFVDQLISAPNLNYLFIDELTPQSRIGYNSIIKAIGQCRKLKCLSIKNTRLILSPQKWLADHLIQNGKYMEELHLTSSLSTISSQLNRAIFSDYCPQLRVLDLSTCDTIFTRTFDAIQLAQNMPNLEILRVANLTFRRVLMAPETKGLKKLQELSMPIGMRDVDRDDALLATLAFGSDNISVLDLRGSCISARGLTEMPSFNVRELHIDDLCPIMRKDYKDFLEKWQHSLEIVSLVKINCADTIKSCLNALIDLRGQSRIKELDLESSDVSEDDLRDFLSYAKTLQTINLSSCRSLPRGCKGRYSEIKSDYAQMMSDLRSRLGLNHSDSETEIDEDTDLRPRKRRRVRNKCPDYVYSDE